MQNRKNKEDKLRMNEILKILAEEYPYAKIQLEYSLPFELLVSTILSAQCTDDRVNLVTEKLFKKYHSPVDYIKVSADEFEKDIFSTGYYKAKAAHIRGAAKAINEKFNGNVPTTMNELLSLPGVGRKTANVILGHCFNIPGVVVDTHVVRITNRLGFADTNNAEKIEQLLMELIPKHQWVIFTHYFILHGRAICTARKVKCGVCKIVDFCAYNKKVFE